MNSYGVATLALAVEGLALGAAALPGILRDLADLTRENVHTVQSGKRPGNYPRPPRVMPASARANTRKADAWERG